FIRAPYVSDPGQTEVLAKVGGRVVAVKYKKIIAISFHPELTGDNRIHRMFLDTV
ncbi:MAG: pyridoxal 5'-phosphate synthase glutaminase subunit PdxT, partial [Abditibacteriota bacterium]|nr:pyridoxal 5'-phosphate synthase glutaminase subunit PdxT [Abditibacteriota bacterium]